jgi:hypothetical protein
MSEPGLSGPAKRTLVLGLITFATTFMLGPVFAFAQRFNGDDIRDGWLTGLLSVGGGCANLFLGVICGLATVFSAMTAITSPNPRDRNAARIGLGFVGLAVLSPGPVARLSSQWQRKSSPACCCSTSATM